MIVRGAQMDAFRAKAQLDFEQLLCSHARNFSAKHTEVLGPEGTLAVVRLAVQRGAEHGFTATGPLELFLDLMFLLGSEFDTDLQYGWAAEILTSKTIGGQMDRADRLHAASIRYLDAVAGPENQFALAAVSALRKSDPGAISETTSGFHATALAFMRELYPQKADYLGLSRSTAVVNRALRECEARNIRSITNVSIMLALEYALGHAITRDPLYPWVGRTLDDERITDPEERVSKLHAKAKVYLEQAAGYLAGD